MRKGCSQRGKHKMPRAKIIVFRPTPRQFPIQKLVATFTGWLNRIARAAQRPLAFWILYLIELGIEAEDREAATGANQ